MSQQEIAHMAWNCSKPYGLSAWLSLPMINHYHHSLQEHLLLLEPSAEVKENWASFNFSHPNPGNNKKEVCSTANSRSNSSSPHDTAGGHGNLNDTTHCNKKDTDEELVQLARGQSWWYTIPDVNLKSVGGRKAFEDIFQWHRVLCNCLIIRKKYVLWCNSWTNPRSANRCEIGLSALSQKIPSATDLVSQTEALQNTCF